MKELPKTLTEAAAALRAGTVTSVALTEASIAAADAHNETTGTYLTRFDEYALARAAQADMDFNSGIDCGPLQGIPFGVKDILAMAEGPTTAQSLVLDKAWADGKDAPVVARLKAAGAVITGKTSTMEFAVGMPDETKPFPIPRNPWNLDTWPGGSSSGTGSGVAAGMFYAGLGTDTGGSIRIPSAFCGITGLMPTFGRVPKSGCAPLGYSLDHIGPMAHSAQDCAAVLEVIAGHHPSDPDCVHAPFGSLDLGNNDLTGTRIGVVREHHITEQSDPALAGCFAETIATLESLGATVIETTLPYWPEMLTVNMLTLCCEALAYHRADTEHRWTDFFAGTREILASGALVSGADYVQAQRVRRVAQHAIAELFDSVDIIACPTSSVPAPALNEYLGAAAGAAVTRLLDGVHTPYWDCLGNPVMAMPMGFTAAGMPLSVQLAGRAFNEAEILKTGAAFQQVTDFHLATPPLLAETLPTAA